MLYFFETYGFDGLKNMGIDVALGVFSEKLNDVILRFYTWKVPTLSLGKHQNSDDIDVDYLKENNFDLVRRPSGGRAVLHWDELTYSVVVPKNHELFETSVLELYNLISKLLIEGLRRLGYPVELTEGKKKASTHVCFQVPSTYEITMNGVKVVGSAQTRTQDYILQHGSIVLIPHDEVKHCFKSTKNLDIPLIGLYYYQHKPMEEIAESIKLSFESRFGKARTLSKEMISEVMDNSESLIENFMVNVGK